MENRKSEEEEIKTGGVWLRIYKNEDTGGMVVEKGPTTTFEDAIGMLHSAIIRFEMQYKIEIEHQNLNHLNDISQQISKAFSELAKHSKTIETSVVKVAAASQNILRSSQEWQK